MAQMHITFSLFEANKNLVLYPNVMIDQKVGNTTQWETNLALYESLKSVVVAHPEWKFVASRCYGKVLSYFTVKKDDEILGQVFVDYKGRNVKIGVQNDRVRSETKRGETKYTQDPVVANKMIRKFFYPKLLDERVASAESDVQQLLQSEYWSKTREHDRTAAKLFDHARAFVEKHVEEYLLAYPQTLSVFPQWQQTKLDMKTVEDIKQAYDKGKFVLVILDGSEYIVRSGNEAKVYNNDTLPEELRAKIGMLKLVEPGQMISGVGCKSGLTTLLVVDVELKS